MRILYFFTAQVDITDGLAYIKKSDLVGRRFKLAQFHFHWGKDSSQGSEHTHDNKAYPAEVTRTSFKNSRIWFYKKVLAWN